MWAAELVREVGVFLVKRASAGEAHWTGVEREPQLPGEGKHFLLVVTEIDTHACATLTYSRIHFCHCWACSWPKENVIRVLGRVLRVRHGTRSTSYNPCGGDVGRG